MPPTTSSWPELLALASSKDVSNPRLILALIFTKARRNIGKLEEVPYPIKSHEWNDFVDGIRKDFEVPRVYVVDGNRFTALVCFSPQWYAPPGGTEVTLVANATPVAFRFINKLNLASDNPPLSPLESSSDKTSLTPNL